MENVEAIVDVLRMKDEDRERLLKMAREVREPAWWELGRDFPQQLKALIDAEQRATRTTQVALNMIPGLLQTRAYTRQIMESGGLPADQVEDQVGVRQVRQGILTKRDPVVLNAFIDETALLRPVGGPRVMAEQLRHVVAASEESNVEVRVIPLDQGAHAGLSGAFVVYEFVKSRPVVYLEGRSSGAFLDEAEDVDLFWDALKHLENQASDSAVSRETLKEYVKRYESEA
ncbi:Scr1 family TA system antitoxin-like transcriptional regulator [Saccharopolyspora sp. NPDC002376]